MFFLTLRGESGDGKEFGKADTKHASIFFAKYRISGFYRLTTASKEGK
jgi:hypothetical protein